MPLYEYQCGSCGHRFERIQKFSDPPVSVCPACGAEQVAKLLSSPAIQFKGSGWYITDYAKSGAAKKPAEETSNESKAPAEKTGSAPSGGASGSTSAGSSSSDSASGSKSDAKPAAKADAK